MLLTIDHLHVAVGGKPILKGLSLQVQAGEVHAIMGPNGAGKSTLARTLLGHEACRITSGTIRLADTDLLALPIEARAQAGLFIGYQYPVEVPGVNNLEFLRLALNAQRKARGQPELDRVSAEKLVDEHMAALRVPTDWKRRDLNSGFSGGEKKRNELLQMFVLEPRLALLDETDSGLDIDALRLVAEGINAYRRADRGLILITHYQRLLDLAVPDRVHVFADGRIVRSGGMELARELEAKGYAGMDA